MKRYHIFTLCLLIISQASCRKADLELISDDQISIETPDWSDASHGKLTEPDYSIVFPQNEVLRFDIAIEYEYWQVMQEDLEDNLSGAFGPGPGGDVDFSPIWVPCSFNFNETEWYKVGIRYKGNSSLQSAYREGINKLSFKLDFDEFEDTYPDIENQRFYGFKQLNLNNNFDDLSLIREKIGSDLFRNFGLVSAKTSFCAVYVDYGQGPLYFGLYTIVEEVDDTVLENQFGNGDGNIYKPEDDAATFAEGTFTESEMNKKNNEEENDYSDVQELYDAIHSDSRTTNSEIWKDGLNDVFDVPNFLKWLAANTVMQNWDTYGKMSHNFYLYNHPLSKQLIWIPWDNNESLQDGKMGGALSLSLVEVGNNWPLISYILAEDEYYNSYTTYLKQFVDEVFIPAEMISTYNQYYDLLKTYVYAEENNYTFLFSNIDFDNAINQLGEHVQERNDAVNEFVEGGLSLR